MLLSKEKLQILKKIKRAKIELIMDIIGFIFLFIYIALVISGKFHKDYYAMMLR